MKKLICVLSVVFCMYGCGESEGLIPDNWDFLGKDELFTPVHAFYLGHSLISDKPDIAVSLLNQMQEDSASFKEQNIPGAPLRWHWVNAAPGGSHPYVPGSIFSENVHDALASGPYTHLIVTDSVPRGGTAQEDETVEYLSAITAAARSARADIQIYYYETWHHITSGTAEASEYDSVSPTRHLLWRPRLEADGDMWQRIVERVNLSLPPQTGEYPVKLIPAGRILGRVTDEMVAGRVSGFTAVSDLFSDDIHLNHYGKYIIGVIHAVVLSLKDPINHPIDVYGRWGAAYWDVEFWDGNTYAKPDEEVSSLFRSIIRSGMQELYSP